MFLTCQKHLLSITARRFRLNYFWHFYRGMMHPLLLAGSVAKIKLQIKHSSPAGKVYVDDASLIWLTAASNQLIPLP